MSMRWVQCDGCDAFGTINEIYCEIEGVIKTEPHSWESPQPYLMTVRPFQVYPSADVVRTRVDLGGANGPLSIASGTPLPCCSIIICELFAKISKLPTESKQTSYHSNAT